MQFNEFRYELLTIQIRHLLEILHRNYQSFKLNLEKESIFFYKIQ